jgi:hypothetical protein
MPADDLLGIYFDPSLGLVAFSFLMWVTLPWAFLDQLQKVKDKQRRVLSADIRMARDWLASATFSFLAAGIVFLLESVFDLGAPELQVLNAHPFVSVSILLPLFFVFGLIVLGFAIFRANQVIYFILYPLRISRISSFGVEFGVSTRNILLFLFIPLSIVEIALGFVLVPALTSPGDLVTRLSYASFLLGVPGLGTMLLGLILTSRTKAPTLSRWDVVGPVLTSIPFVLLILINNKIL